MDGGRETMITVSDPGGDDLIIHKFEKVPNVLGWPRPNVDPPIEVVSNGIPVSILRYNDNQYLEGGQPIKSNDIYVVVKSNGNCIGDGDGDDVFNVDIEYEEAQITDSEWDNGNYTNRISISATTSSTTVATNTTTMTNDNDNGNGDGGDDVFSFLDPSSFLAEFSYTGGWCSKGGSGGVTATGRGGGSGPATGNYYVVSIGGHRYLQYSRPSITVLITIVLSTVLTLGIFWDYNPKGSNGVHRFLVVTMMIVTILAVVTTAVSVEEQATDGGANNNMVRDLQGEDNSCMINVEILLDGCRRQSSWNGVDDDLTDLVVYAPSVRVIDIELTDQMEVEDPKDKCTTNYEATLTFPLRKVVKMKETMTNTTHTMEGNNSTNGDNDDDDFNAPIAVQSIGGDTCARAVEGRPFVDAYGHQLQATLATTTTEGNHKVGSSSSSSSSSSLWSVSASNNKYLNMDDNNDGDDNSHDAALGKEWVDRALGEHASIPAFATFVVSLMSNNAPPTLIEEALTAAMDEVRHAKTSFEIASLLLGKIVEPGPLPPSKHQFESNLTTLAISTALEGCIDETLSALIAAYEVDVRIDQNQQISDDTKNLLKDKLRTIALEETRHSALAWKTIQWVCSVDDSDDGACSAVHESVLNKPDLLDSAFQKRFNRYYKENEKKYEKNEDVDSSIMVAVAEQSWKKIYNVLIPFVTSSSQTGAYCEQVAQQRRRRRQLLDEETGTTTTTNESKLYYSSFLEEMTESILIETLECNY